MNEKAYNEMVNKVNELVLQDGRPLYLLAPSIGISVCALKRFLDGGGVTIFTVIQIADYFKVKIFS